MPSITQAPARSGNYSRGRNTAISQITFHHIVGDAQAALHRFQNTSDGVSSTYVISSSGQIFQCVAEHDTPHTNGNWASNSRSITIEHAGGHPNVPYTEAMYRASIELVRWIRSRHNIASFSRHRDIVATACPGGLDVERIIRESAAAPPPQGDPPMTRDEEASAYQIVLGRPMEHNGSGRSGYKFIVDAKGEIDQQRQAVQETLNSQSIVIVQLKKTVADLQELANQDAAKDAQIANQLNQTQAQVAELTAKLKATQTNLSVATKVDPPAPKTPLLTKLILLALKLRKK